jgi:APA family basic amino acid/polyamine antiporter
VLYVAVNSVFLFSTPLATLSGQPEVAHLAGVSIFGPSGARLSSGLICVGLIANVSGMMWIGSRISQAMGRTYHALQVFRRTTTGQVPVAALVLQYIITLVLLCFDPKNLINYVGAVLIFWSLLAVLGVMVLRVREPDLPRPYRAWGYPVTPLLFAVIALFCLVQTFQLHRTETLIGAATVLLGVPVYFLVRPGREENFAMKSPLPEQSP